MQDVCTGEHPGKSSETYLPMIDLEPTNLSCIYTTLCFVTYECAKQRAWPIVTFDQPLWWKAKMIVHEEPESSALRNIILSLGSFHTLMNFLGCIGYLMESSGMKEVLELIYGENAVKCMLMGKSYER